MLRRFYRSLHLTEGGGGRPLALIRPGNADKSIMDCTFVTWIFDGARGADKSAMGTEY